MLFSLACVINTWVTIYIVYTLNYRRWQCIKIEIFCVYCWYFILVKQRDYAHGVVVLFCGCIAWKFYPTEIIIIAWQRIQCTKQSEKVDKKHTYSVKHVIDFSDMISALYICKWTTQIHTFGSDDRCALVSIKAIEQ